MMLFSIGLGWSVLGVVGPDPDCFWAGQLALDVALLCKDKKEERAGMGFARGHSDA